MVNKRCKSFHRQYSTESEIRKLHPGKNFPVFGNFGKKGFLLFSKEYRRMQRGTVQFAFKAQPQPLFAIETAG